MSVWKRPSEELPECEVGDRVIGILSWREGSQAPLLPHVVVFEALEHGWEQEGGYDVEDCELWIMEKDLVKIARGD